MCPSPQAAEHSRDAAWVAVTRISGIVFGVFLSLLLCVLIFPKSATHEAVDNMWHAFADLSALHALAWSGGRTEGPPGGQPYTLISGLQASNSVADLSVPHDSRLDVEVAEAACNVRRG